MKMSNLPMKSTLAGLAVMAVLSGCKKHEDAAPVMTPEPSATTEPAAAQATSSDQATAQLNPTQGSQVSGTVTFSPAADGVLVTLDLTGLTPGPHGFHVHENGDCSAPDASSAGGHFNPSAMPHGAPDADRRHAGDFGNVQADASGNVHAEFVDKHLSLQGEASIIGRSAVVHEKADDLTSQPAGNSGARLACGVIQAAAAAATP